MTNIHVPNKGADSMPPYRLAATFFITQPLPEETSEQFLCQLPVVAVDTVFHFGRFHLTLDKACLLQLFQMLGDCGFGYWELLMDITEIACLLSGKKLEYGYPCGVSHRLGESRQLFLSYAVILICHVLFVRKVTNAFSILQIFTRFFV